MNLEMDASTVLGITPQGMCVRHPHIRIVGEEQVDEGDEPNKNDHGIEGSQRSILSTASSSVRRVWHTCPICTSENRACHVHPRAKSFANVVDQVKQLHKTPQFHTFLENWATIPSPKEDDNDDPLLLEPFQESVSVDDEANHQYDPEEYEEYTNCYEYEPCEPTPLSPTDYRRDGFDAERETMDGSTTQRLEELIVTDDKMQDARRVRNSTVSFALDDSSFAQGGRTPSSIALIKKYSSRRFSTIAFSPTKKHSSRRISTVSLVSSSSLTPTNSNPLFQRPALYQEDTIAVDKFELQSLLERIDQVKDWVVRQKDEENERLRREIQILQDLLIERQTEIDKLKATIQHRERIISHELRAIKRVAMLRQQHVMEAVGSTAATTASASKAPSLHTPSEVVTLANSNSKPILYEDITVDSNRHRPQDIVINHMKVEVNHRTSDEVPLSKDQLKQLLRVVAAASAKAATGSSTAATTKAATGSSTAATTKAATGSSTAATTKAATGFSTAATTKAGSHEHRAPTSKSPKKKRSDRHAHSISKSGGQTAAEHPVKTADSTKKWQPVPHAPTISAIGRYERPKGQSDLELASTEMLLRQEAYNDSKAKPSSVRNDDSCDEEKKSSSSEENKGSHGNAWFTSEPSDEVMFTPTPLEARQTLKPLRQSVGERILFADIIRSGMVPASAFEGRCLQERASTVDEWVHLPDKEKLEKTGNTNGDLVLGLPNNAVQDKVATSQVGTASGDVENDEPTFVMTMY